MRIQILVLRFKELMKNLKWNTWNISPSPFGDSCACRVTEQGHPTSIFRKYLLGKRFDN